MFIRLFATSRFVGSSYRLRKVALRARLHAIIYVSAAWIGAFGIVMYASAQKETLENSQVVAACERLKVGFPLGVRVARWATTEISLSIVLPSDITKVRREQISNSFDRGVDEFNREHGEYLRFVRNDNGLRSDVDICVKCGAWSGVLPAEREGGPHWKRYDSLMLRQDMRMASSRITSNGSTGDVLVQDERIGVIVYGISTRDVPDDSQAIRLTRQTLEFLAGAYQPFTRYREDLSQAELDKVIRDRIRGYYRDCRRLGPIVDVHWHKCLCSVAGAK